MQHLGKAEVFKVGLILKRKLQRAGIAQRYKTAHVFVVQNIVAIRFIVCACQHARCHAVKKVLLGVKAVEQRSIVARGSQGGGKPGKRQCTAALHRQAHFLQRSDYEAAPYYVQRATAFKPGEYFRHEVLPVQSAVRVYQRVKIYKAGLWVYLPIAHDEIIALPGAQIRQKSV